MIQEFRDFIWCVCGGGGREWSEDLLRKERNSLRPGLDSRAKEYRNRRAY